MRRWLGAFALIIAASLPASAVNVDRDTVRVRAIEPPLVDVSTLDIGTLIAKHHGGDS